MPEFLPGLPQKNRLLFDWLSFTIVDYSVEDVVRLLGLTLSEFTPFKGRYGYKQRISCGGINVYIDGTPDKNGKQNICVEMSGQGCRDWETLGFPDYFRIFDMALCGELKLTRIDIAYDDFQGLLPFQTILDKSVDMHEVVSTWRAWEITKSDKGDSVTYGSRQSNCFARCYDKARERNYCNGEHWIRFETVFREELALQVAALIIKSGSLNDSLYFGILQDKIRYVEPSDDSNKSRWSTSAFWDFLTSDSAGVSLTTDLGVEYNLDQKEYHLFQQYGKSIITLLLCRGFDNFVDNLLAGNINIDNRYKQLINQFGLSDDFGSISSLYKLREAIKDIRKAEFEYYFPVMKVGDSHESYD